MSAAIVIARPPDASNPHYARFCDALIEDPNILCDACKWSLQNDSEAVNVLILGLLHSSHEIRRLSASWLGSLGQLAGPALPVLRERSRDPHIAVRVASLEALKIIALGWKEFLPFGIDALHDSMPEVRWRAAELLGIMGADAAAALPTLAEVWESERNIQVRRSIIHAMELIDAALRC
ncbi:MAG: HEAT repeat domain-containing protein [Planctomycetes bacterium]|nr:HEAT repeat domain-containing protein [Planctomycetota bacterium]